MSLASWFTASPPHRPSALNRQARQPHRQPTYSRPILERLEERTLLDAAFGLVGGGIHNLNLNNNFSFGSSANILPTPGYDNAGTSNRANGADPQHALNFSGLSASGSGSDAAASSLFAQDQPYAQFRAFGANSEGEGFQLFQQSTANILRDAYGFGSGTQPNAPWKPNAYNLGLANGQFGYSTQSDMGFSSVPPWVRRGFNQAARSVPKDQSPARNRDQIPPLNPEKQSAEAPEELMPKRPLHQPEQEAPQDRMDKDKDTGDPNEDLKGMMDQPASEKQSPIESVAHEDGSLPDSLWLSAFTPVPMTALVAGLPGMAAEAEDGEASGEAGAEAGE